MSRCVVCGRLFDQILASQKTCSGTCERMRPTLRDDDDTPSGVGTPDAGSVQQETEWRTCQHKGCGVDFRVEKKRGRPAKNCPDHRRTA